MSKLSSIIFTLMVFLTIIPVSFAIDFQKTYQLTDLPVSESVGFNFSLLPNSTIFFNLIQNDSLTAFQFPKQINLTNSSIADFQLNYSIPFLTTLVGDQTVLQSIVSISNNVNGNIVLLNLKFTVLHPVINASSGNESFFILNDAGRRIEIHTFSAVNYSLSHGVILQAPNNSTITISCGVYISCPNDVNVTVNNETFFDAQIFIPKQELPGNTTSFIAVTLGNNTRFINFTIEIRGDDIFNVILYDVFAPSCYDTVENLADCYKQSARYNAEVARNLLNRIEKRKFQ